MEEPYQGEPGQSLCPGLIRVVLRPIPKVFHTVVTMLAGVGLVAAIIVLQGVKIPAASWAHPFLLYSDDRELKK